ncbi:heme-binding protein [Paracoccaceae bacterium]|nr:heme-binding protein [Paracoccaceae bacterium]
MNDLTLRKAKIIIRKALEKGKELGFKPLSVAVLDAGGHLIAFERSDGAAPGRVAIATGKAYGAVMLGMAGGGRRALMARAEQQAYFMQAVNGALQGQVVPVPGGVLIRDAKLNVVGAVGVTGDLSDNDEICAIAGVEATNLTAEA